ncbi:MAG: hypothetical protein VKK05_09310, partial [Synechococcus sp.]|nr:hypothetical protein [Synechococcus sp.]
FKITAGDILKINGGTITADSPVLNLTQTWNNAAVTFTGLKFNVPTDSSASASLLMDLQVGGTSKFSVSKGGGITSSGYVNHSFVNGDIFFSGSAGTVYAGYGLKTGSPGYFGIASTQVSNATPDVYLYRDAAGIFAQRNAANAQTFRIYNTYTDATNTFERGKIAWESNVLRIGTEKGVLGGTARALELQTDGTTRLTIASTGAVDVLGALTSQASVGRWNGTNYFGIIDSRGVTVNVNSGFYFTSTTNATSTADSGVARSAAGKVVITDGSTGAGSLLFRDAGNIEAGTTTGTKIGTATSQKLAFWNATPVVQPTTGITAGTFVANTSGISDDTATFDGYTI